MEGRTLLNASITKLEDMIDKGNVWYATHYRQYFDRYVCAYVLGKKGDTLERDGVSLVPLGTGRPALDLLVAPWRVYRLSKACGATHFISADLILAWWHFSLLRLLTGGRIVVMPVCNPEEILRTSGRSYSGLPAWLERLFIHLSFRSAGRILCVKFDPSGVAWVRSTGFERKLKIVGVLPEEFSTPEFLQAIESRDRDRAGRTSMHARPRLVYVGRLEKEKLVDDLIDAMARLRELGKTFTLTIVGDGAERSRLERRVLDSGLGEAVLFAGFVSSEGVAQRLADSDIFVSPYTGTSLREAALAGLAIVAYRLGWVEDVFRDGENCLLAEAHDSRAMASRIAELIDAPQRRAELGARARQLARDIWSTAALRLSLQQAFE